MSKKAILIWSNGRKEFCELSQGAGIPKTIGVPLFDLSVDGYVRKLIFDRVGTSIDGYPIYANSSQVAELGPIIFVN